MGKRKIYILAGVLLLVIILTFRELGWLDINLYQSRLNTNAVTTTRKTNTNNATPFSYHIVVKYRNNILLEKTLQDGDSPMIEVKGEVEDPVYSGDYFTPFYKSYRMKFVCEFTTEKSGSQQSVDGKSEGEVEGSIIGICSIRKAKKLALDEAVKIIQNHLELNLK